MPRVSSSARLTTKPGLAWTVSTPGKAGAYFSLKFMLPLTRLAPEAVRGCLGISLETFQRTFQQNHHPCSSPASGNVTGDGSWQYSSTSHYSWGYAPNSSTAADNGQTNQRSTPRSTAIDDARTGRWLSAIQEANAVWTPTRGEKMGG